MGTTAEKLTYLNETKTKLKDMLNLGGASLTTEPFRQYVDTLKNRYLYFMNNGTQQVWNNWDKVTGEGTTITLNNTEEAPMTIVLKGNTSQEGTPTPETPQDIHVVSGDNSIVVCGKNLFKEWVSGSVDGQGNFTPTSRNRTDYIQVQPSTTYTLWREDTGFATYIYQYNASKSYIKQNVITSANTTLTLTSDENTKYAVLYQYTGYSPTNKAQLELGNQSTTYEAYKGASYPVNLPVENILDITSSGSSIGGVPFTIENGIIKINGTTSSSTASYYFNTFRAKSESAVFSIEVTGYTDKSSGNSALILQQSDDGTTGWSTLSELSLNSVYAKQNSVTLDSSKYYRLRWYVDNNTFTNATIKAQLEYGNKKNSFTPYGTTPIELCKIGNYQDKFIRNSGKNLLDRSACEENKTLTWATGVTWNDTGSLASDFIKVNVGDKIYANYNYQKMFYDKDKNYLGCLQMDGTVTTGSNGNMASNFVVPNVSGIVYMRLGLRTSSNPNINLLAANIMVNKGDTLLDYEPYGSNEWYVKKEIDKIIIDGTEATWVENSGTKGLFQITLTNVLNNLSIVGAKADWLRGDTGTHTAQPNFSQSVNNTISIYNSNRLFFRIDDYKNNLAGLKTYLGTHNLIAYYIMQNPTYTKIEGDLANQLDKLSGAKSYNNQTNISQENNDLASILNATALEEMA